jgi:serine phosphatase RsbU (regulator of sigma subunit)
MHILIAMQLTPLAGARTEPLAGPALEARLQSDTNGIALALIVSFVLLSNFVQREGTRYVRAHTEIRLATDIHRLLVPAIARRIGRFEFHGISFPSGDVGGDLIDLVEFENGWIAYVADVSGPADRSTVDRSEHGAARSQEAGHVRDAGRFAVR